MCGVKHTANRRTFLSRKAVNYPDKYDDHIRTRGLPYLVCNVYIYMYASRHDAVFGMLRRYSDMTNVIQFCTLLDRVNAFTR